MIYSLITNKFKHTYCNEDKSYNLKFLYIYYILLEKILF